MSIYSASATKTSGAAAGWVFQLRQPATNRDIRLYEIGLYSTTAAAGTYGLTRSSTVGATFTTTFLGTAHDPQSAAGTGTIDTVITTAPVPVSTTNFWRTAVFPATAGSGVIWTFPNGVAANAGSGFIIYQTSAVAVGLNVYCCWDE